MKLIRIDTILKQTFCFIALFMLVEIQFICSPLHGLEGAANKKLLEGFIDTPANMLSMLISAIFGISGNTEAPTFILGTISLYAFLWGIFWERYTEDPSLEAHSKTWIAFLFIYSCLLSIGASVSSLYHLYTTVRTLHSISHVISALFLIPAFLVKYGLILSPCFIAIKSGRALFKKHSYKKLTTI